MHLRGQESARGTTLAALEAVGRGTSNALLDLPSSGGCSGTAGVLLGALRLGPTCFWDTISCRKAAPLTHSHRAGVPVSSSTLREEARGMRGWRNKVNRHVM
jgi:hypothetical protein